MFKMIVEVLIKYNIFMQQLTPNAIVRLIVFIWAVHNQGVSTSAKAFYRAHELHYQTKVRPLDDFHNNLRYYNFSNQKDMKSHVLAHRTKWSAYWTTLDNFYVKADSKEEKNLKVLL